MLCLARHRILTMIEPGSRVQLLAKTQSEALSCYIAHEGCHECGGPDLSKLSVRLSILPDVLLTRPGLRISAWIDALLIHTPVGD